MHVVTGNALVTGGSRGIGRASALALAAHGADVAITYVENEEAAQATAQEIRDLGRRALVVQADAADVDANVAAVGAAVSELGPLRTLVCNAANGTFAAIDDLTVEEWDATMGMHARALFVLAKEASKSMRENGGGSIIAVSSIGSLRMFDAYAAFGTSKAAVETLIRYLANEYGPLGIRANAVVGGTVLTDLFKSIPGWEGIAAAAADRAPLRTVMDAEDLADAVLYFASDGSRRVTGQALIVDAGYTLPA